MILINILSETNSRECVIDYSIFSYDYSILQYYFPYQSVFCELPALMLNNKFNHIYMIYI